VDGDRGFIVDRLFIAIPELAFRVNYLDALFKAGFLTESQYEQYKAARRAYLRLNNTLPRLSNRGIVGRILAVAPELFSIQTVDLLRTFDLLTETQGHALRLAIRSTGATLGSPSNAGIFNRLRKLINVNTSFETINLWRSMGLISVQQADKMRGIVTGAHAVDETIAALKKSKSIIDSFMILDRANIDGDMLRSLVLTGMISARTSSTYRSLLALSHSYWQVFQGVHRAEGLAERLALVMTGSLNDELVDFLLATKLITKEQYAWLQVAVHVARMVNDDLLERLIKRRFRIALGEAPIKTFARASRESEASILRLLAEAAKEAEQIALGIEGGAIGAQTRAAQLRITRAALYTQMRLLWDGAGYLTIFGERQAAEAAVESMDMLQRRILSNLPDGLERSLLWQAKAGVDSYISRRENTLALSRRVYKNLDLYMNNIDKRISLSLLQGKSSAELAADIARYINPRGPGGVSYAANRLARTEIANAFQLSTIRYTRENPWVLGYKWNLSGSHSRADICNQYAEEDHVGMGKGVFKKNSVPSLPHPHCFCYITVVQMDNEAFLAAMAAGRFSSWMSKADKGQAFDSEAASTRASNPYYRAAQYGVKVATMTTLQRMRLQ
jgi:hypothetical protein